MRPAPATTVHVVDFRPRRGHRATQAAQGRVQRVVRLLALAHRIDEMIRAGELRDLAHAAEVLRLTRARMTQIVSLTLLAPAIQQAILALPPVTEGRDPVTERQLRPVAAEPVWDRQLAMWRKIRG